MKINTRVKNILHKTPLLLALLIVFVIAQPLGVLAEVPTCEIYSDPTEAARCQEKIFQRYGVSFLDADREKCNATSAATTAPASKNLFVLGDSIGDGVKGPLASTLGQDWTVTSDTKVGRPLSEGITIAENSPEKITGTAEKPIGAVLVVLGTNNVNNTDNEAAITRQVGAIKKANATATIYWLSVHVTKASFTEGAKQYNEYLAKNSDITVLQNTADLGADGVHPKDYNALAKSISTPITGTPSTASANTSNCEPCGASAVGGGSNNEETVFKFFVGNGYTKEQSAGIVGNMIAESGVNPKRVQGTKTPDGDKDSPPGGGGYGLVQWTPGTKILADAKAKGVSPGDLNFQMGLLLDQLEGRSAIAEKAAGDDIKLQTTVAGAAKSFMLKYERPADKSEARQNERARLAEGVFQRYGPGVAGVSTAAGGSCSGGGAENIIDGFVVYSQTDERWASSPYGSSTVGESGCGPSAVAMVVSTWVDKKVTPDVVAKEFASYYVNDQGSKHDLIPAAVAKWGLKSQPIGKNMTDAQTALRNGNVVIAVGHGANPFTTGGHFIVLRGITAEGKILVGDSGHSDTSDKEWDPSIISSGLGPDGGEMWVISK